MRSVVGVYRDRDKGRLEYVSPFFQKVLEAKHIECKASSSFCLDIGMCSKLRSITLEAPSTETSVISNLVGLLSTLRNPAILSRIRVFANDLPSANASNPRSSHLDVWRRLDDLLCGLSPQQTQNEGGGGLTFQIASRRTKAPPVRSGRLFGLLPKFSRVGTCEEVRA